MRKVQFITEEYYHIYNRGVDKRDVFRETTDYLRFLQSMQEFNNINPIGSIYEIKFKNNQMNNGTKSPIRDLVPALVDILAYSLIPNHFHIIIRQSEENGVSKYMHKLCSGYTSYFNRKYDRSGSLFQGSFQATHIDSKELLPHLSVYVNCNHIIHNTGGYDYKWSSYLDYVGERNGNLCNKQTVLSQFKSVEEYHVFINENLNEIREIRELKKLHIQE